MTARLLEYSFSSLSEVKKEIYFKYEKKRKNIKIKIGILWFLEMLGCVLFHFFTSSKSSNIYLFRVIKTNDFILYPVLIIWMTVMTVLLFLFFYYIKIFIKDFPYKNLNQFDVYNVSVQYQWYWHFFEMIISNEPKIKSDIVSIELHKSDNDYFILKYTFFVDGKPVSEVYTEAKIKIKLIAGIDELWFDLLSDCLYVPESLCDKIASEAIITVDTFFTENKELRKKLKNKQVP